MARFTSKDRELGLDAQITRRDFVGGTLAGAGVALLGAGAPSPAIAGQPVAIPKPLGPDWTGYGGVGDYARSNGNTYQVVNPAHAIRDHTMGRVTNVKEADTHERYDMVIVGGGFSGFGAAYTFLKERGNRGRCLVLDNHPIYGGEAKQNEFLVDDHRLFGPQGSNAFVVSADHSFPEIWRELGLPEEFSFQPLSGTERPIRVALDNFGCMMKWPGRASVGYFFPTPDGKGKWVIDAQKNRFADAPWSDGFKRDLNAALHNTARLRVPVPRERGRWLDSMTYRDFLVNALGLDEAVLYRYIDPYFGAASFGISGDAVSAYGAYLLQMPGTLALADQSERRLMRGREFISFPGGNALILRHLLKAVVPAAIAGDATIEQIGFGPTRFDQLDRLGEPVRVRLASTVSSVQHVSSNPADGVLVDYYRGGELERVHARGVVVAASGQIARRIVRDQPRAIKRAYEQFHHAPMLVVNIALRNWRFMERLGISAARWFEGFGWFANFRAPMTVGKLTQPLNPDEPIVLTMYVSFTGHPRLPLQEQVVLGRQQLIATSYSDYERQIREQLTRLFGDHGFDARRDIAGIVLNRWGHAYICPQVGFYFGLGDEPPPGQVVAQGFGRIAFGHSELKGYQAWFASYAEGRRAALSLLS